MQLGEILRDRYQIISRLGQGNFGETFLAEDLGIPINPKPKCVVKRLKTQNFIDAQLGWVKNAFEQEAAILYNLGKLHPQIPQLSEYFELGKEFYLVQDFIDGIDLTKIITPGKKISEVTVTQLLEEILEVLAVVHQQNIIHRDINPKNIMRRNLDGKIVLIDFGAVKQIIFSNSGQTSLTMGVGTPGFMPLEQFNGKPKLASDIYAVGMVGVQALTGIPPHLLDDDEDGEAIWQDKVNISERFADILRKMVNRRASQRFQDAAEAMQAMRLLNQPIAPTIISPPLPLEETYKEQGDKKYNLGDYQGAIEDYDQAININPNDFDAYCNRGLARDDLGDYQGAIEDYDQAININPNYADAYHNRGITRKNLGDYQGAIEDYGQAININPNEAYTYYNRGITRINLGDYQGAIEDFDQAININPNEAYAYNNRGLTRKNLGDYQGAIEDFDQAININPNKANAYYNRGLARDDLGDYQGAIEDYDQAININPNYADAYHNRGTTRGNLGDYQGAIEDYDQAININPNKANAYNNRGLARKNLGDYQGAIEDYGRAANLYKQQGKESDYQDALNRIKEVKNRNL